MIDSTIFVTVRSRLTGRKFFTPDTSASRLTLPKADDEIRSVKFLESDVRPPKRGGWACVTGAVEAIMVILVSNLTRCIYFNEVKLASHPAVRRADSKRAISAFEGSFSVLKYQMMKMRSLSRGLFPLSSDVSRDSI